MPLACADQGGVSHGVSKVLSQAREAHQSLDAVASNVTAALGSMLLGSNGIRAPVRNLEELQHSVAEAERRKIMTDDAQKAKGLHTVKPAKPLLEVF